MHPDPCLFVFELSNGCLDALLTGIWLSGYPATLHFDKPAVGSDFVAGEALTDTKCRHQGIFSAPRGPGVGCSMWKVIHTNFARCSVNTVKKLIPY